MKKEIAIIASMLFVSVILSAMVLAGELNQTGNLSENGTIERIGELNQTGNLSENGTIERIGELDESVNSLKIGWENSKLWFTFNKEKRAMQELKLAHLHLVQAKIAAKKGDTEAMDKAIETHNRILEKVKTDLDKIDGQKEEKGIKNSIGAYTRISNKLENHKQKIETLKLVLENENLTDIQRENIEKIIEKAENKTEEIEEKQEKKREETKTRLMAIGNKTEEEAEDLVSQIENGEGKTVAQKIIAENMIQKTEETLSKLQERIDKAKEKGNNLTFAEEQKAYADQKLSEAKELYENESYQESIELLKDVSNFGRNWNIVMQKINQERNQEKIQEIKKKMEEKNLTIKEIKEKLRERKEKSERNESEEN